MAKSKSGGTRSYIRGRVGADVYSIGKDAKGSKQQVVRSLAETVANPQTEAQMRGRMIMSTVMQMLSIGSKLWDHAFDGYPVGQPSLSRFIALNYALIKADIAAHPAENAHFQLNAYQEKGAKPGMYQISEGTGSPVAADIINEVLGQLNATLFGQNKTLQQYADKFGIAKGDYITMIGIGTTLRSGKDEFFFVRAKIADNADMTTVVSAENVASLFSLEGDPDASVSFAEGAVNIEGPVSGENCKCLGAIISKKIAGGWEHGTNFMKVQSYFDTDIADDVLPTYPIGEELILNGGEI